MFSAMVLGAGFGRRLLPLTDEVPKALLPIGSSPHVGTIVEKLLEGGARHVAVNAHHLASKIDNYIKRIWPSVHVSHEERILGTAGGLRAALPHLKDPTGREPIVVTNADVVIEANYERLLVESAESTMALLVRPADGGFGTVGLDESGCVVRLRGEVFGRELRSADYVGTCCLRGTVLDALPQRGCLIGDVALPLLRGGGTVVSAEHRGGFVDYGTPRAYLRANLDWLARRDLDSWVAGDASVAVGVRTERSLIGAGASISGQGSVSHCVVLAGASVSAPLESCVVLPSGKVVPVA